MDDLLFLPLDIPPIPDKQLILDAFRGTERYVWWDEQILLGNKDYTKPLGYPEPWNECASSYQSLIKHIETYLPFEWFSFVRLARAHKPVGLHIDDNFEVPPFPHHKAITKELKSHHLDNEPIGYRIILSGSRDTFYFCKDIDLTYQNHPIQKKHYVKIPESTDFFLIKNYQQPHGVDTNEDDNDRIVGFLLGKVNVTEHKNLIARSLQRYNDYVLRELYDS